LRYSVEPHRLVRYDLDGIRAMLADYADDEIVRIKVAGILARMQALDEMPHIGTRRDEVLPRLRIVTHEKKAVIAFRVDDRRRLVEVLAIT
jgi:plasmid stabilization system protein ParE